MRLTSSSVIKADHAVDTYSLGTAENSVVDLNLNVYGMDGLRGDAEKAAGLIRAGR